MNKIGMFVAIAALGATAGEPYSQVHRIFAAWPEKIERAVKANPGAFRDGIIVAAFPKELKPGPEFVKEFANQKAFCERMQALGVKVQFAMSSTIGHNDGWTRPTGRPVMVGSDGRSTKAMSCPRSDAFKAHVADLFSRYASLHPEVIWWDDDFRMVFHAPADYACFCGDCIGKFNAACGTSYERAALIKAIQSDATVPGGRPIRQAWRDFNRQALTDLVKISADAAHKVDPDVGIGFMVIGLECGGMLYATPDFKEWTRLARNRAGKVWYRHGSGAYTDWRPEEIFFKNLEIGRLCAASEGDGVVNWTEGVIVPFNRRAKSMRLTFLEAALNVGMAGADGATYDASKGNLDEQLKDTSVVPVMGRRRAELDEMRRLIDGKRQIGVAVPPLPDGVYPQGPVKRFGDLYRPGDLSWRKLIYIGVPLTFRREHAACELPKGMNPGVLDYAQCEKIKDELDRRCGGRMPSRVDSILRFGQSVWESPDGSERIVFLWNFDYDDAEDVRLVEDKPFAAEEMVCPVKGNGESGPITWRPLGCGDTFTVSRVPALSVQTIRLTK